MTIKIKKEEWTYGEELECPTCNNVYLHQGKVEVFDCGEDMTGTCLHVVSGNAKVEVDKDFTMNPSPRRHGLRVHFSCEAGCKPVLNMLQHKGNTFLYWDEVCGYEELKDRP
jgi:hypothetical protein